MEFDDWEDDSLLSLTKDPVVPRDIRTYAGWELDYRGAFGITYHWDAKEMALRRSEV